MLIKKIILENYGLYAGRVELNLAPRSAKPRAQPIILFGGKNGAGKTTLLEALRLVLYGKGFTNIRLTNADYDAYLKERIHNGGNSVLPINFARIAIEFNYVTMGEQATYYVERSWKIKTNDKGIEETLQISINGHSEENVTEEYWKGFIEGIIPERLSQLFFFDGEKIKNIASDDVGNDVLADSIKTLLGLDIVEKLKADLTIYKNRALKNNSITGDKRRWVEIDKTISQLKWEIDQCLSEKLPSIRTKLEGKLTETRSRETDLHKEGNLFVTRRDSIKMERNKLASQVEMLEAEIRQKCEGSFPFCLCPTISGRLRKQIETEAEFKRQTIIRDEIETYTIEILDAANAIPKLDTDTLSKFKQLVTDLASPRLKLSNDLQNTEIILGLTEVTANTTKATLENAEFQTKQTVHELSIKLQTATHQLREITIEMGKIPKEEQVKPIFMELAILNQERGALQQEEKRLLEQVDIFKNELKTHQKELEKLIERQKSQDSLMVVDKINQVLDAYLLKLTISKTDQLKRSVAEAFNCLSRKGDMLKKIEIDPMTFEVTLYDHAENSIPKKNLSSGEKQLYAIAMLWGLAKTSGRPLPVIIDTPLARLDSDHRMNLITNYFPEASHQVILLSTDTEVDQMLFSELKPFVSHCYHLKFDPKTQSTGVEEEYFWPENNTCLN
ncbi:MAG: DNA sulfur modification protein DndD [Deltaproteobacteria bacterium]|nr:DNA sulfur modification protein DndD [Deltaproteobacteria bacterium]